MASRLLKRCRKWFNMRTLHRLGAAPPDAWRVRCTFQSRPGPRDGLRSGLRPHVTSRHDRSVGFLRWRTGSSRCGLDRGALSASPRIRRDEHRGAHHLPACCVLCFASRWGSGCRPGRHVVRSRGERARTLRNGQHSADVLCPDRPSQGGRCPSSQARMRAKS
jgi:hypothetical protein